MAAVGNRWTRFVMASIKNANRHIRSRHRVRLALHTTVKDWFGPRYRLDILGL